MKLRRIIRRASRTGVGASDVEYSLLVALIAAVIIVTVSVFGLAVRDLFLALPNPWP